MDLLFHFIRFSIFGFLAINCDVQLSKNIETEGSTDVTCSAEGENGNTGIMRAVMDGRKEEAASCVDQLELSTLNRRNRNGDTVLHLAIRHKNFAVLDKLMNVENLDLEATNSQHETPLIVAVKVNDDLVTEILKLRFKTTSSWANAENEAHRQLKAAKVLNDATRKQHEDILHKKESKYILELEAKIRTLVEAIKEGNNAEVNTLLGDGDGGDFKYYLKGNGCKLIHIAVLSGNAKAVEMLLAHEASINVKDSHGKTPLITAAQEDDNEICKILLAADASVTAIDKEGNTALTYAVQNNNIELTRLFLEEGASTVIGKANKLHMTPLMYACNKNSGSMVNLLMSYNVGATAVATALMYIVQKNNVDMAKVLLDVGAQNVANNVDENGKTPLLYACEKNSPRMAEILTYYADDHTIAAALMFTVKSNNDKLTSVLLKAGAYKVVNEVDGEGLTPLMIACRNKRPHIAGFLLAKRADITATSRNELYTALHFAIEAGSPELVQLLLDNGAPAKPFIEKQKDPLKLAQEAEQAHPQSEAASRIVKTLKRAQMSKLRKWF